MAELVISQEITYTSSFGCPESAGGSWGQREHLEAPATQLSLTATGAVVGPIRLGGNRWSDLARCSGGRGRGLHYRSPVVSMLQSEDMHLSRQELTGARLAPS